jgi:GntR family transcriptional repressor for pyruvate dehydrogenase complex
MSHRIEGEKVPKMSPMSYEQVQNSRLYEKIVAQIQQRIMDGELKPGDRLPPVPALVEEFGVSRTVIREAIQFLQSKGLVTVKHGSGMFVSEPTSDTLSDVLSTIFQFRGASAYDLHEVREILEVEIAALAAERASEEDKAELLDCLEWMRRVCESPREYIEVDLLFHGILARATGNEVFLLLLETLIDLLRRSRVKGIKIPGGVERSFRGHKALYRCIRKGDSEGARIAMREHLRDVRERLEAVGETKLL